ncbi:MULTISPECIES: TonB system transport protein ExbD [Rhizobium/Agrobacterium group]|uniref:TonB system transport protein ExbD n=1 Tax=Rhizobium/Agrobacterium group TaxID=227290 RepID=UPI000B405C59|nr:MULTISPECIES: TonB system transport protein ExbD [Rhizobium/Agrobacterium group]MCF1484972.1 TonB system transport protein ExbD [Allorhizobium ampelinum]NSZ45362.1 TonB system transport protein ExbD [Agrobacterium vitis]NTA29109.1 TonB system transport protein ExbD [Allorhizobium ampelinum]OVE90650.1 TonB system transport protein ExbD [Allorhizobium ampelinum]
MAGGIRENSSDDLVENHEINVTPFIDVMLVLLIIFMVAAPLATVDVNVDLPASSAAPAKRQDEPVYLTLKQDLSLALGNDTVSRDRLPTVLEQVSKGNKDTRIFLRADKNVGYGEFMTVMNLLRDAGYLKIALVGVETLPQATSVTPPAEDTNGQ